MVKNQAARTPRRNRIPSPAVIHSQVLAGLPDGSVSDAGTADDAEVMVTESQLE
ncbi:hypothetical protein GCM10027436_57660 [Actinophytocola sediminis]